MGRSQKVRQAERNKLLAKIGQTAVNAGAGPITSADGASTQIIAAGFVQSSSLSFSGPLPPPGMLKSYDEAIPGCAATIIQQFAEQGTHRRWAERHALTHNSWRSWGGLLCGLVVAMFGLWVAKEIGNWPGATIGAFDLAALVAVFVYGSNNVRQEREERTKTLAAKKKG